MTFIAANFFPSVRPARVRPWAGGVPSLLGRLLRRLDVWDRSVLHALSDHTLRDMGLMRDQIEDIVRGAMRRM